MSFWKKLWEAVFCWRVEPSKDVGSAQVILIFAGGGHMNGTAGQTNDDLARSALDVEMVVWAAQSQHIPILAQAEARISDMLYQQKLVEGIPFQTDLDKDLDTLGVAKLMKKICDENGWNSVVLIAPKYATWRTLGAMKAVGFSDVLVGDVRKDVFFWDCAQWGGRLRYLAYARELVARVLWVVTGKI